MDILQTRLLPARRVLSRLFRKLFTARLQAAHMAGRLSFFGKHANLANTRAFTAWLDTSRKPEWVVYAKRPFAGPEAVLAYLSRYTHRVAIANSRLVSADKNSVTFRYKDYRTKNRERHKTMTIKPHEFIRRFLIHVLPSRFHRIRHYGLFANGNRVANIARARELLDVPALQDDTKAGVVAWSVKRSERALPETDFRRCVQNWDGQVRSSG